MALTAKVEVALRSVGLDLLYNKHQSSWRDSAKKAYDYVRGSYDSSLAVRPDDVALVLQNALDLDAVLREHLNIKRCTQKYWVRYFTDYVIDQTWESISNGGA